MYIQEQLRWDQVDDERLSFLKAIGVDYLTIYPRQTCATAKTAPTIGAPCERRPSLMV
ncbi:hypothetical protein KFU94_31780 [Chloroflexi bacterium TSY]|nr:hypothetical protein [Chloroflexi bacterium TSY]